MLREGSATGAKAEQGKLKIFTPAEAAKWADMVMILTADKLQADLYRDDIKDNLK